MSGATVVRRRPSMSGSSSSRGTSAGIARWAGLWAPRRAAARNGPSRLNPSGCAPSSGALGSQPRTRSAKRRRSGSGAVQPVGRNEVTPRRRRARAIPSRAAASAIALWPPQPWTWRSTRPRTTVAAPLTTTSRAPGSLPGGSSPSAPGHQPVAEVARHGVFQDQLRPSVRHDLALDDDLAVERLRRGLDPRRRGSAPAHELDRLPGSALRRPVAGVHDRVDDVAVVERLAWLGALVECPEHVAEHVDVAELGHLVADREDPARGRLGLLGDVPAADPGREHLEAGPQEMAQPERS